MLAQKTERKVQGKCRKSAGESAGKIHEKCKAKLSKKPAQFN